MTVKGIRKVCPEGHVFYKSSDCLSCPTCEKLNAPADGFLSVLSAPARRALIEHDADTLEKLSLLTEKEVLSWHGMGKSGVAMIRKALSEVHLSFATKPK